MDCYACARERIDAVHATDPQRTTDGRAAELVYADRMETWLVRLVPDASPSLRLAARAQHLERWAVPRNSYPEGKAGYHAWRKSLYVRQAEHAQHLLREAGVSEAESADVAGWVSKTGLKTNPGSQALEDAACLVFLENGLESFKQSHPDAPDTKLLGILAKIWAKMSPAARRLALDHHLAPDTMRGAAPAEDRS